MTVALYARVSSQRQTNTQTIEQQLDRLRARVEQDGVPATTYLVFRDNGYNGTSLRRPGLDALRDAVASAEVERVLITAPDRLARKYVHQVLLLEELKRFGRRVEFLDRLMSHDPHDQLLLQIRGAVAEYERTLIAERMQWSRSTLRWMLCNPVYLGQVYANRTNARPAHQRHAPLQPIGQQGTTLELTAHETWLLVTTIPPQVSQEVFDQVQGKLAEKRRLARRHTTTGEYLVRALVSCGVCGYACKARQEPPRYAS